MPLELALCLGKMIRRRGFPAPGEKFAQPILPGHSWRKPEGGARTGDVGGAMPDVAAPELAGDARLEIVPAGKRRKGAADVGDPMRLATPQVEDAPIGPGAGEHLVRSVGNVVDRDEVAALP